MATTTTDDADRGRVRERSRRRRDGHSIALVAVLVPPVAWLVSLAASYLTQDFTCSAFISSARAGPDMAVLTALLVGNGVLLGVTAAAGGLGWWGWRGERQVDRFLGGVGVGLAVIFGLGIVLIAVPPIFLEVCP